MTLDTRTVIVRSDGLFATDMDGEVVMMSVEDGTYYHLDPVGADIWAVLEAPCTVEDLLARLLAEYDVPEERCREETLAFLEQLLERGIVKAVAP